MAYYRIELPHSEGECIPARNELLAKGPEVLAKYAWECGTGKHTASALLEAQNENAARELVPNLLKAKARITRVKPE